MAFAEVVAQTETALGTWVGIGSGFALIASLLIGGVVKLTKGHIGSVVQTEVAAVVPRVVDRAMNSVHVKLDAITDNQDALAADVAVVRRLEVKIENGLSTRVANIDNRQRESDKLLSEVHGWLQAREEWDRKERRTTP